MANYTATLTVQNVGAGPTTGDRTVTITLPSGWSYASNTGGYAGSQSGQALTLTKSGALASGASDSFGVVLAVATAAADGAATLAFAVATAGDASSANNSASLAPVVSHPSGVDYSATLLALAPALYWRLGETSGTVAADASGNARPGVINGTVAYNQTSLIVNNGGDGAMQMNAGGKVTRANASAIVTGGSISQVVWATVLTSPSGNVQFGGFRTFGSNEFYITQVGGSQTVEARFTNSAGIQFTFSPSVGSGTHMLALVFNAATNRLDFYVDGVAQTQLTTSGGYASGAETLTVGDSKGEVIDEYALFNTALTAAQIQDVYNAGKASGGAFTASPVWSDEFTGTALSYATDAGGGTWRTKGYEFGGTLDNGFKDAAGSNWNISPTQNPADNPFSVANSVLTISAKRLTAAVQASVTAANAQNVEWQGGYLVSNHLAGARGAPLTWRYGYFEFRARFPNPARGMFPALWLFNNDAGVNGSGHESAEIDIFEIFGNASGQPWASGYHNKPNSVEGNIGYWTGDDTIGWHRYGVEWTATAVRIYRDGALKGELTGTSATWFQNTNLGLRINYAIDPNWEPPQTSPVRTTTSDPAIGYVYTMDVDYVRVYSSLPANLPTGSAAPPLNSP